MTKDELMRQLLIVLLAEKQPTPRRLREPRKDKKAVIAAKEATTKQLAMELGR